MTKDFPELSLPRWVPDYAARYLQHIENGKSIRDLAREVGCHASTILRQIRRTESRRDDPLVDSALSMLASIYCCSAPVISTAGEWCGSRTRNTIKMQANPVSATSLPDTRKLQTEAIRILRRLCESGAVLAVAENMEKAVVVRDDDSGASTRTAVVDNGIAQAMALKDWITCSAPGRISRYYITATGRTALSQMLAEQENRVRSERELGFQDEQRPFSYRGSQWDETDEEDGNGQRPKRVRYNMTESPLVALARRRDRNGKPFLNDSLVRAGERLREDFELAQMGPKLGQNWDSFLTGGVKSELVESGESSMSTALARERVIKALSDLGPGLSDVALRCCCFLEGLETAEKRLGWSARSGKIVLRIALQRLRRHYETQSGPDQMIG
ncbi:hypothetical protein ATO1_15410 [Phaeobacter sp. 22II1-1F12B]|nr:DUF6456 domain-containing protein [Phaeobacter sp. 22II1-1F12B]OWU77040.1 hypothetical protein ATO1_15410 [Phaeobacter sp. 22II1-1F12B]